MKKRTIKEINEEIQSISTIEALRSSPFQTDERKGVQQALLRQEKKLKNIIREHEQYEAMCQYENEILAENPSALICGIDEVGRGPLAGPVVTSAVILNPNHHYIGINDSKKLSARKRQIFEEDIRREVQSYAYGIATVEEIDQLNIYRATQLAMQRAVENLNVRPTHLLIDAMKLSVDIPQTSIIKGDAKSISIACASILAKESRDRYMRELDQQYPGYDFAQNVGYGTQKHLDGIHTLGITPEHRKSFEPIKSIIEKLQN